MTRVSHRGSAIEEGGILTITIGLFFENNMLLFSIAILAILQGGFGGMFSEFRCPPPRPNPLSMLKSALLDPLSYPMKFSMDKFD